jgi:hypothetical protein
MWAPQKMARAILAAAVGLPVAGASWAQAPDPTFDAQANFN